MNHVYLDFSEDGKVFGIRRVLKDLEYRCEGTPDPKSAYWVETFGDWGRYQKDEILHGQGPQEMFIDAHEKSYRTYYTERVPPSACHLRLTIADEKSSQLYQTVVDISELWKSSSDLFSLEPDDKVIKKIVFEIEGKERIANVKNIFFHENKYNVSPIIYKCCVSNTCGFK
jgi:hypothetical protein